MNVEQLRRALLRDKPVILLPFLAGWLGLTLSPHWHPTWDSAVYIAMGKSIISGDGLRYMGYGGIKYPPGFPLMLGLIIGPFGYNFLLMRLLIVASAAGSLWLAYLMVRDRSNRWVATAVMCSTAFSFPFLSECTRILSDMPYTFLSLLALYWVERYARDSEGWRSRTCYICIALLVAAFLTRIVGLALFAGAIAYLACGGAGVRRSRANLKKALAIGIVLFTIPPTWMALNHLDGPKLPPGLRESLTYEREFLQTATHATAKLINPYSLTARMESNLKYYERLLSNIVLGTNSSAPGARARVIALVLLAGYLYCLVRRRSVLEFYIFFLMLTYILWPSKQGERFLVPIIPILLYYLFQILTLIVGGISRIRPLRSRRRMAESAAVVILTGVFIQLNREWDVAIIEQERARPYYVGYKANIIDVARWLKENTPPDARVLSDLPSYIYLFSDRRTYSFRWSTDHHVMFNAISRFGPDYLISNASPRAQQYLWPVLEAYAAHFDEIYRRGDFGVYRVSNQGSGG